MATPPLLDVEELLQPIAGENPSGQSLAYEPAYDELREARRAEDDTLQGDWQRRAKTADWERVIELGTTLLKEETKDLQIAAWVAEALARRHAFAGLRDGLLLIAGLQERFWDSYYPEVDDGDLESRHGPFVFLDGTFPAMIRSLPVTSGFGEERYSFFRWQESRATDNVGMKNPEQMEALIAEGKITGKQFDDAVAQTPRRFYEELVEDLRGGIDAFKALDKSLDERFGRLSPGVGNIRKALEDCRNLLEPILRTKRELEPDPSDEVAPADESEAVGEESGAWAGAEEVQAAAPRRRPSARSSAGPIASVADAQLRIAEAAAYLRENDPASPVPYLVVRALRSGELYGLGQPPDVSSCDAPASEVRQSLRRLLAEGDWAQLLEQSEQALARPEGRAWLDPHRYALTAMASSYDPDRTAAAGACRSWLRAWLADFPELPDAELGDGTPTASADTRAWLRDEVLPPPPAADSQAAEYVVPEPPPYVPEPAAAGPESAGAEPDAWDQALDLVRQRRTPEAIDLVRRAMAVASTGRDRFLRKLQLAELCLMANRHHVALPISEDLARQVDEFRLEDWESEQLCARVWAAFYRCLRSGGANGNAERLQQVFARLCRLDVNQAMTFGADGAG